MKKIELIILLILFLYGARVDALIKSNIDINQDWNGVWDLKVVR